MTIKHLGGIFGRNPTFNEVTADGNFYANDNIIMADGKGIDFSATSGTGTSELFDDYEEGTWTPVQGVGLTVVGTFSSSGTYTKIGRFVMATATLNGSTSVSAAGGSQMCTGLPFTVGAVGVGSLTDGSLAQSGSAAAYIDRIYAGSNTSASPNITATVVYTV
jgi:hypothetical protein